jgi:predicted RNA-binding protein YlxR (DUF448 family)
MGIFFNLSEEARRKISESQKKRYQGRVFMKKCAECGIDFETSLGRTKQGRGVYCSKNCLYNKQKKRRNSIKTEFKKGMVPWNKTDTKKRYILLSRSLCKYLFTLEELINLEQITISYLIPKT